MLGPVNGGGVNPLWSWCAAICGGSCVLICAGGCYALCAIDGPLPFADASSLAAQAAGGTAGATLAAGLAADLG